MLQQAEARAALLVERNDLAVEQCVFYAQFLERARDAGELVGPVLARARVDANASAGDRGDCAIAIVLDLVQPVVARGRRGDEGRELRGHEAGQPRFGLAARADRLVDVKSAVARHGKARLRLLGAVLQGLSICIALLNEQPILAFFARGLGKPQQREAAFQPSALEIELQEAGA